MTPQAPSPQQLKIFDWFGNGEGNLVVRARAGTGKTTTIVNALKYAPERNVLLCAFDRNAADELARRVSLPNVLCKTLHGVGFKFIAKRFGRVRVCEGNERETYLTNAVAEDLSPDTKFLISKLHTKARELAPLVDSPADLEDLAFQYDCVPNPRVHSVSLQIVLQKAYEALELAAEGNPAVTGIDFADMIFLPIRRDLLTKTFDLVVIDEAQDMSAAQLFLAQNVARGRIVAVGDDRQAIYAFRGADSGAIDRLKLTLNAKELGLTVTYRCAKVIVEEAQRLVPDIVAHEKNPLGSKEHLQSQEVARHVKVGSFILSRKNSTLVPAALAVIKAGKRASIIGRDVGRGIQERYGKIARKSRTVSAFLKALGEWEESAVSRAMFSNNIHAATKVDDIRDTAAILRLLAEEADTVQDIKEAIDELFTCSDDPGKTDVICSSIHKAKGKEADDVYVLQDTLYPKLPCHCGHWHLNGECESCGCGSHAPLKARMDEEENLEYVSITRAKKRLIRVHGTKF